MDSVETEYRKPEIQLVPHRYSKDLFRGDGLQIVDQVIAEFASGRFDTGNEEFRKLLAQLGFSSLWGFLRLIASNSGPYELLTDHLHLEMANFYQDSMYPGSKAACFIGRSHYKSSVFTHGANTWELLRNPELHINLCCGIEKRALEFLHYTQDTIAENELFKWLYGNQSDPWGCYVPENVQNQRGWNDIMLTLPNKKRNKRHPNITIMTAGGSTAGAHDDLIKLDDIISDVDLDSARNASASMQRKTNWMKSSIRTLVKDWKTSRVFLSGTRYGVEDSYEHVMRNCKKQVGYWDEIAEEYPANADGEWDIYYRMIREKGRIIFPESFTEKGLQLLEQDDPWTYWTQYVNNPFKSTFAELNTYAVNQCRLYLEPGRGYRIGYFYGGEEQFVDLEDCDVIQCIDPAASESRSSARTSRTANVVLATAPDGKQFVIKGKADYMTVSQMIESAFHMFSLFKGYIRITGLELKGPFKLLYPEFRRAQQERGKSLHLKPVNTNGDKDARIRSFLEPVLMKGNLYCVESFMPELSGELRIFPDGPRKDVLDALAMCMQEARKPKSKEKIEQERAYREVHTRDVNYVTGM